MTTYKFNQYLSDHSSAFFARSTLAPAAKLFFDNLGTQVSHIRVGNFEVAIAEGIDLWAAPSYDDDLIYTREEFNLPGHYYRFRKDRLSQLNQVEVALKDSHPYAAELRALIATERAM